MSLSLDMGFQLVDTDAEIAAFAALPYVLSDGVEVYRNANHKDRGNATITFAAPVVINGKRGNMVVSVIRTTDNFYRTHRIVTPDGPVFLCANNDKTEPTSAGGVAASSPLAERIGSVSSTMIQNSVEKVNTSDKHFL